MSRQKQKKTTSILNPAEQQNMTEEFKGTGLTTLTELKKHKKDININRIKIKKI